MKKISTDAAKQVRNFAELGTCQESCVGENHAAVSKREWNMVLSWGKAVEIELERLGLRQRPCSREETTRPSFNFKLSSD